MANALSDGGQDLPTHTWSFGLLLRNCGWHHIVTLSLRLLLLLNCTVLSLS